MALSIICYYVLLLIYVYRYQITQRIRSQLNYKIRFNFHLRKNKKSFDKFLRLDIVSVCSKTVVSKNLKVINRMQYLRSDYVDTCICTYICMHNDVTLVKLNKRKICVFTRHSAINGRLTHS